MATTTEEQRAHTDLNDVNIDDKTEQAPDQTKPQISGWKGASNGKLAAGLGFGIIFGFLLQKGGVAKFDILIGALLLENFVVVKVMLSAIIVGMVGSYFLRRTGVIERQINETKYGANITGGLIFGVGFGLLPYCPGTDAAAVGQGNLDALVGIAGLVLGSYIFALTSKFTDGTISRWGERGKLTIPNLLKVSEGAFIAIAAPFLIAILAMLELAGK
ncbi:hypothetical protein KOR42_34560 [Thalassoglobus neptunius]|uniref:Uncharacterized protein n=1 Tax=Thalassoglobus neptunius TaxID=1938619 RepID=A0A5C5WLM5_9PLAN|nr:YeeE/YedE thiosulfate transporter family protein [Thalassoglobus neptunius]TWT51568.1 hypothetical protein KOR42_34560 [Thalassoglobus neptunius]